MKDNQANYAKIGFAVVLGIALVIGTLVYLGGMRDANQEFFAETYFQTGVSGLDVGSAVNLRGVKVGEVRAINFVGNVYRDCSEADAHVICVKLALNRRRCGVVEGHDDMFTRKLLDRGLRATVSASGVTGLSRIELDLKPEITPRKISWKPKYASIPPAPSILDSAAAAADRIMAQLDRIDLVDGWTNIVNTLTTASSVLDGADRIIQSESAKVSEILENVRGASSSLHDLVDELKSNPSLLIRSRDAEPLEETK